MTASKNYNFEVQGLLPGDQIDFIDEVWTVEKIERDVTWNDHEVEHRYEVFAITITRGKETKTLHALRGDTCKKIPWVHQTRQAQDYFEQAQTR